MAGGWHTVTRVEHGDNGLIVIAGEGWTNYTHAGANPIRVSWPSDVKRAKLRAALEYQATLTKTGTPRKAKAVRS
jgi:hypothetical protein